MTQTDNHFISSLSSEQLVEYQKLATRRLKLMGISSGHIPTQKPAVPSKVAFKRLSIRRNKPEAIFSDRVRESTLAVSRVFGRPLRKVATVSVDPSLLDDASVFQKWLINGQQELFSDSESPPPFLRGTPLRRSCPMRPRDYNSLQRRPQADSTFSITDLDYFGLTGRPGAHIPCFVLEATRHLVACGLTTEGVFRKSGSHLRMRQLREQWETGLLSDLIGAERGVLTGHYRFSIELHRTHDIAGLLKEYMRELPQPLLTRELLSPFLSISRYHSKCVLSALRSLVCLLPDRNRVLLQLLLLLCQLVLRHSSDNKMDSHSLATVLAPGILPNLTNQKEYTLASVAVVRQLINSSTELFQIPSADWTITETLLTQQTTPKDKPTFSDSARFPAPDLREDFSPLTVSCYVPTKLDQTINSPDSREERTNNEFGQKVKRFFKRALHSPFESPTSQPKLKVGRIPSPTPVETHTGRERSRSNAELVRELSNRSPLHCGVRHPTGPSVLFRAATENTMRHTHNIVPIKQQFIIRPIQCSSPDLGPSPRVLPDPIDIPQENNKRHFSRYTTHLKILTTSQSANVNYRYRSNSSQAIETKFRTVLPHPYH